MYDLPPFIYNDPIESKPSRCRRGTMDYNITLPWTQSRPIYGATKYLLVVKDSVVIECIRQLSHLYGFHYKLHDIMLVFMLACKMTHAIYCSLTRHNNMFVINM